MCGGPSHVDLLDPKPKLTELDQQLVPEELIRGERFAFITGRPKLLGSPYNFQRHGESGLPISTLLPHLATIVDNIAVVRSVYTNEFNHGPAQIYMNAGDARGGRRAWVPGRYTAWEVKTATFLDL